MRIRLETLDDENYPKTVAEFIWYCNIMLRDTRKTYPEYPSKWWIDVYLEDDENSCLLFKKFW